MTDIAILLLSLVGFSMLLLAMGRHQRNWFGRKLGPSAGRALRLSGFGALTLGFAVSGAGLGWAYGTLVWFGWLTVSAMLVVISNIARERIPGGGRR